MNFQCLLLLDIIISSIDALDACHDCYARVLKDVVIGLLSFAEQSRSL
jgi:hypothetical protein